ncbi:MAG: hypothetical protein JWQ21_24 [Herminiimonas sp.]|nr:hypothetical protein [Herminiimonas sp.]
MRRHRLASHLAAAGVKRGLEPVTLSGDAAHPRLYSEVAMLADRQQAVIPRLNPVRRHGPSIKAHAICSGKVTLS